MRKGPKRKLMPNPMVTPVARAWVRPETDDHWYRHIARTRYRVRSGRLLVCAPRAVFEAMGVEKQRATQQ